MPYHTMLHWGVSYKGMPYDSDGAGRDLPRFPEASQSALGVVELDASVGAKRAAGGAAVLWSFKDSVA